MEEISYKLEVFEGPMDLLLSLISKHKLDIYDIPITELVDQYMDYVRRMQESDMDVASEFLEMAARLVYIKTVSLLPTPNEAEDLKKELTGELLEYRDCQIMAGKLAEEANGFDYYTKQPDEIEIDPTYELLHEPMELLQAYKNVLGKGKRKLPPPVELFTEIVKKPVVSVSSKINFILNCMTSGAHWSLRKFLETSKSRSDLVATFLAVLELIKDKKITTEEETSGEMDLELKQEGML